MEKAGIGGYEEYRIPAIAVTDRGTVLTAWESRKETGNDWAECHITVRRSTDDGKSFGEPQYIKGTVPPEERIVFSISATGSSSSHSRARSRSTAGKRGSGL